MQSWDRGDVTEPTMWQPMTSDGIGVATYSSGARSLLALRRGPLAVFRDSLVIGDKSPRGLVVFRDVDITWDGHSLRYRDQDYEVGDWIEVGGGQMELSGLDGLRLPSSWTGTRRAFVVMPSERQRGDERAHMHDPSAAARSTSPRRRTRA